MPTLSFTSLAFAFPETSESGFCFCSFLERCVVQHCDRREQCFSQYRACSRQSCFCDSHWHQGCGESRAATGCRTVLWGFGLPSAYSLSILRVVFKPFKSWRPRIYVVTSICGPSNWPKLGFPTKSDQSFIPVKLIPQVWNIGNTEHFRIVWDAPFREFRWLRNKYRSQCGNPF